MCSRYAVTSPHNDIREFYCTANGLEFPARSNIAPTQPVVIIRNGFSGGREMVLVRWGLIPPWVKEPVEFATLYNARAETVEEKPSFRGAIRHRRCLIPADGFYEWSGPKGRRQAHFINRQDGAPIAFAGLWEHWIGADGSELETMVILTVPANSDVAGVHDRMPLILEPEDFERWLDCRDGSAVDIRSLLVTPEDLKLKITPVSSPSNTPEQGGPTPPKQGRLL